MSYRILFLNWQDIKHPLGGGAEVYHQEIFKRIIAKGNEVSLICSHYPGLEKYEEIDGMKIYRHAGRNWFNFAAPSAMKKHIKENKTDIVIDSINKIPLLSPLFVKNIPVIAVSHHLFGKSIFSEAFFPLAAYVYYSEKLIRPVYKNVPFISVSESTRKELTEYGIKNENISIIENCVDHDLYTTSDEPEGDIPLVGYLGRIKKYKSVDHLIRAFKKVKEEIKDAKLIIVGDGDNLPELKELAGRLDLGESAEFTGFLDKEKKVEILQKCHVVVNPSVKEGWGLTVIESNACGTPVVAADVPGLRDSVIEDKTGILYKYGDIDACAENIIKLLSNSTLRNEMRINAIEWAAKFDWDNAAEKTLDMIKSVLEINRNNLT
ncbi:MAG: glycosyltransferase family 4 protein [bacterium]|nr:glycosyltransferase family 4 protein [bacterium]